MPGREISSALFPLACSAAAPSRLRHALSSVRLLSLVRCDTGAHFAAVVIANSLEGALLRVSLDTEFAPGGLRALQWAAAKFPLALKSAQIHRDVEHQPKGKIVHQHGGSPIGDEWQRDTRDRQKAHVHAHIFDEVKCH